MSLSGRRLLVVLLVAALGGAGTAGAKPRVPTKTAAKHTSPRARVRAVKVAGDRSGIPSGALAALLAPLTGTAALGGAGGGAAAGNAGAGGLTTSAPTPPTTTTPITTPAPPAAIQAVGVTLDDRGGYSARLSRATVTSGDVVVQLINQGEDDHNLRVVPTDHAGAVVDFPLTASGANAARTLTLAPGRYRLFCTLTTPVNHETAGMNATLNVASP